MHKKPAPLRVVPISDPSDRQHPDEQLVLERRVPEGNRYAAVQMNIVVILLFSSIIAAMIYDGIGKLLPLGESYNWWLFFSLAIPLSAAFGYFVFLADRGPGWTAEGYKYKAVSQDLRNALPPPMGSDS